MWTSKSSERLVVPRHSRRGSLKSSSKRLLDFRLRLSAAARPNVNVTRRPVEPCRCPVWEKHSISYPTSSDAPFQSQLLLACLPFLSASIQPCHVGCEDQLFPSGQCNCNNLYTGLTFCSV
ncbi:unnamed protein product [Arctogadus glacialis]